MKEVLPHIEDSSLTTYIPPKGAYESIKSDEHYAEKWQEWSMSGKNPKKELWYKGYGYQRMVTIVGYEVRGENDTLVIQFQDGNLSCILPGFLKEMQNSQFQRKLGTDEESTETESAETKKEKPTKPKTEKKPKAEKPTKEPKPKKEKLVLPTEKVSCSAAVKEFTKKLNHFTEEEEDVVVYEHLLIGEEQLVPNGLAWSSHSKTLQKLELQVGDKLTFQAKVVPNKFGEVLCKINNPSKIQVQK